MRNRLNVSACDVTLSPSLGSFEAGYVTSHRPVRVEAVRIISGLGQNKIYEDIRMVTLHIYVVSTLLEIQMRFSSRNYV